MIKCFKWYVVFSVFAAGCASGTRANENADSTPVDVTTSSDGEDSRFTQADTQVQDVVQTDSDVGGTGIQDSQTSSPELTGDDVLDDDAELDVVVDPLVAQCAEFCAAFTECDVVTETLCNSRCVASGGEGCDYECISKADKCAGVAWCLDVAKPGPEFTVGDYGVGYRDLAGPFTVETLDGPWDFEANWTGNDSYIFFTTQEGYEYPQKVWSSAIVPWLTLSPSNTHYFFLSFDKNPEAVVMAMKEHIEAGLAEQSSYSACHWRRRIHYVTGNVMASSDWLAQKLAAKGDFSFAIDRHQRLRQIGSLGSVLNNWEPAIVYSAYEAQYFNFEFERQKKLDSETITEVVALDKKPTGNIALTVTFPPEEEMASYDTLAVDLGAYCGEFDDANCGKWDKLSWLMICHRPKVEENPYAETACQPKVDGETPVDAETKPCQCITPEGLELDSTHTCNGEGTGFGNCACPCDEEIARWITTYKREGRWVTDISPFLAKLKKGGKQRLHYKPGNSYVTDLSFRLSNTGKGMSSDEMVYLFGGGGFNLSYNEKYEPMTVSIPDDVKRVELVAYITGHGWGKEAANCAEFCLHTHHFTINGETFVRKHDKDYSPGNPNGCAKHVPSGVVPNQYGTWPLGRAGWCPGLEVKPWISDVTSVVTPGKEAVISYKGLFKGKDYEPKPATNPNNGGFGAQIKMNSWLVYYR